MTYTTGRLRSRRSYQAPTCAADVMMRMRDMVVVVSCPVLRAHAATESMAGQELIDISARGASATARQRLQSIHVQTVLSGCSDRRVFPHRVLQHRAGGKKSSQLGKFPGTSESPPA